MKLVSLSSREFRMAPGDSIFAARKKKKRMKRIFGTFLLSFGKEHTDNGTCLI